MQRRTEILVAVGAVVVLFAVAGAGGRRVRTGDNPDRRASSFLTGQDGLRGLADVAERGGIRVERWRRRTVALDSFPDSAGTTFVLIEPTLPLTSGDRRAIASAAVPRLVLAGTRAGGVMRCFGYRAAQGFFAESVHVAPRPDAASEYVGPARAWLLPVNTNDSTEDVCDGAPGETVAHVDTMLVNAQGGAVMLELTMAQTARRILMLADADLLRNRSLRELDGAATIVVPVLNGTTRLVFDEYHHGFGPGGSMGRAAIAWSRRHPVGWMLWQLLIVGVLALAARGVRFGPVVAAFDRRRRSSLEHVRALATALASARGGEVAVGAMVRGLRRRLARGHGDAASGDWRTWLDQLEQTAPDDRVRAAAARLRLAAANPKPDAAVFAAANAAEDVWSSLHR